MFKAKEMPEVNPFPILFKLVWDGVLLLLIQSSYINTLLIALINSIRSYINTETLPSLTTTN